MAQWNLNPSYTELESIMLEQATRKVGLTAEQFNKVMENIQYLKNLYDLYKVSIGAVTVIYAAPGTPFDVDIVHRQETEDGELVDYLDFTFTMATAKITTSATSQGVSASTPASVIVTPTPLANRQGYNFDFNFSIPKGTKGDKGDRGNVNYATFAVSSTTGMLIMTTPDGYSGATFSINNNGYLEVNI